MESDVVSGWLTVNSNQGFIDTLNKNHFRWIIKNGKSALFCEDLWYKYIFLGARFSRLYKTLP